VNNILEYFPIKRYGAIALLVVFPIFALYYYFVVSPSLYKYGNSFILSCDEPNLSLTFSTPKYISSTGDMNLVITNQSSQPITDIKISTKLLTSNLSNYALSLSKPLILAEDVNISELGAGKSENKSIPISTYGVASGTLIKVDDIVVNYEKGIAYKCGEIYRSNSIITFNQALAWLLLVLQNIPVVFSSIFAISAISCSVNEDDTQDFHPSSRIGKYYIGRVICKALTPVVIFYILGCTGIFLAEIGGSSDVIAFEIISLGILIFLCFFFEKLLTKLIVAKPKAVIIVDATGKEKEVEIIVPNLEFNKKEFEKIISRQSKDSA
jgi:hypothetical protein